MGESAETRLPIAVLLMDVGGVLVRAADPERVAALERRLDLPAGGLNRFLFEQDPWYGLSTGRLDEARYWDTLGEQVGMPPDALHRLVAPVWEVDGLDTEVIDLVRAASRQVRVAVLSNATPRLEERLQALSIADLFDPIINSSRVGLRKPDPEIYRLALRLLEQPAGAVLFVDDKERNTLVSRELGIPSITFTDAGALALDLIEYGLLPRA